MFPRGSCGSSYLSGRVADLHWLHRRVPTHNLSLRITFAIIRTSKSETRSFQCQREQLAHITSLVRSSYYRMCHLKVLIYKRYHNRNVNNRNIHGEISRPTKQKTVKSLTYVLNCTESFVS